MPYAMPVRIASKVSTAAPACGTAVPEKSAVETSSGATA